MKNTLLAGALMLFPLISSAQEQKKEDGASTKVTIQTIEEKGGDRLIEERRYYITALTPEKQRAYVDSLLNSLSDATGSKRVTVTLEDNNGEKTLSKKVEPGKVEVFGLGKSFDLERKFPNRAELDKLKRQVDSIVSTETIRLDAKTNRLMVDIRDRSIDFGTDLNERLGKVRSFAFENGFSNSSKTVRYATITPNRPFDGFLNVKFTTKEKGDVFITVMDTKGKELAKKELKDFEGEFVGQVKIKNSAQGVLFVNIVQNEDGVSQRVRLPSEGEQVIAPGHK